MNCHLICRVFVLVLFAATSAYSAVYHVAQTPAASDENVGSEAAPWKTISGCLGQLQPGDTVMIHRGIYREWVAPRVSGTSEAPIAFRGVDRDEVVLTGADAVIQWEPVAGQKPIYRHGPWPHRFVVTHTPDGKPVFHHPADQRHELIGRPEQVIVDGALLQQVLAYDELTAGKFFVDLDGRALFVWLWDGSDPGRHEMQASTRGWVFGLNPWRKRGAADYIQLENVTIRYAANFAQRGALWVGGDGWRIENVTVEWTNGNGATMSGRDLRVKDFTSRYNGQMGMGGGPSSGLFEDVKLLDNNLKGYNANWEAGGMKFAFAKDTKLVRVEAARNKGPGIWFDIDNRKCSVTECHSHHNTGSGIFVEISGREGFEVTDNRCIANGLAKDSPWGSAGIKLGESCHCLVQRNLCVGNKEGISIRMQGPRTCSSLEPSADGTRGTVEYVTGEHKIDHNLLALNRDWQLAFWGDNPFFGPHPSGNHSSKNKPLLDPEKLNLDVDSNLYFALEDQGLVLYGPTWRPKHEKFVNLAAWQRAHRFDRRSTFGDPGFEDAKSGDFRMPVSSPAFRLGTVPRETGPPVAVPKE